MTIESLRAATGVQPQLLELLSASTKAEADRIARTLKLRQTSLVGLIQHHELFGFGYQVKHFEHIPDDALMTSEEHDDFFEAKSEEDRSRVISRLSNLFEQRKLVSAHLFFDDRGWHIFYWSQKDLRGYHGRMGPHVHYVSHLCLPGAVCGLVWQELDGRAYKIGHDLHIQYVDQAAEKHFDVDAG